MTNVEQLIAAARGWRGLEKLVVTYAHGDQFADEPVKLGPQRGRWKRVAAFLASFDVVAAKGYSKGGELIGGWQEPEESEDDIEQTPESPAMVQHRAHTRWVMEFMAKHQATNTDLTIKLVEVVLEILRRQLVQTAAGPPATEDEATKTLQMLLTAAMAARGGSDAEAQRPSDGGQGNSGGQG